MTRHFLVDTDLSPAEQREVLDLAPHSSRTRTRSPRWLRDAPDAGPWR
jgi:hypothetical protein